MFRRLARWLFGCGSVPTTAAAAPSSPTRPAAVPIAAIAPPEQSIAAVEPAKAAPAHRIAADAPSPPAARRPPRAVAGRSPKPTIDVATPPAAAPRLAIKRPPRPRRIGRLPLQRLGLFGKRWRLVLQAAGIETATDLLAADAARLVQQLGLPATAVADIARWQAALRLAALVPPLSPRGALLLIAVHRRDLRKLAAESPGRLHRDLTRYALSSAGQSLLRGHAIPDLQAVRRWVAAARRRSGLADADRSVTVGPG